MKIKKKPPQWVASENIVATNYLLEFLRNRLKVFYITNNVHIV